MTRASGVVLCSLWLAAGCGEGSALPSMPADALDGGQDDAGHAGPDDAGTRDATLPGEDARVPDADAGRLDAEVPDAHVPDAGSDAGRACLQPTGDVDFLLMVDDSGSMQEEQFALQEQLPYLINALATGDRDGDGVIDFDPAKSLRLGVINPNLGAGGYSIVGCQGLGDDGLLRTWSRESSSNCQSGTAYPSVHAFEAGQDATRLATEVSCVARTGTNGCGFEQQLEATLKALSPALATDWTAQGYVPPVFYPNRPGHGDTANEGLLRKDAVLAILMLTDEDDCSASNVNLFDSNTLTFGRLSSSRCVKFPEQLQAVQRYVDGFKQLRDDPGRLVFSVVAGLPPELDPGDQPPDFEALLAEPSMQPAVAGLEENVVPSCDFPDTGRADPPQRLVRVASELASDGALVTVHSICKTDYRAAVARTLTLIAESMRGTCGR